MAHIHNVIDSDVHYKIDKITRDVANTFEIKKALVQHDHNSERITFEMPRYIDGHDIMECNRREILFINTDMVEKDKKSGKYEIKDLQVKSDDENTVTFSWLVSGDSTEYAGTINFNVRFSYVSNENVEYSWNTAIIRIKVIPGMPKVMGDENKIVLIPEFWYERIEENWK